MTEPAPMPLKSAPWIADWLQVGADGHVTALSGRVELGQGAAVALARIVALELGLPAGMVSVQTAHTDRTPDEGYTAGSMSVSVGGMALRWAASALRHLVCAAAAPDGQIDIVDGRLIRDGAPMGTGFADLAPGLDLNRPVVDLASPRQSVPRPDTGSDLKLRRADLSTRLTGAPFVQDLRMPGMIHGAPCIRRSWRRRTCTWTWRPCARAPA